MQEEEATKKTVSFQNPVSVSTTTFANEPKKLYVPRFSLTDDGSDGDSDFLQGPVLYPPPSSSTKTKTNPSMQYHINVSNSHNYEFEEEDEDEEEEENESQESWEPTIKKTRKERLLACLQWMFCFTFFKTLFSVPKPRLVHIGQKIKTLRAEFPIFGGYIRKMGIDMPLFLEMENAISKQEFEVIKQGIEYRMEKDAPVYHCLFDGIVIVLAILIQRYPLLWTGVLLLSIVHYQNRLQRTQKSIQEFLEVKNDGVFTAQRSHWKWGPPDYGVSFEFPYSEPAPVVQRAPHFSIVSAATAQQQQPLPILNTGLQDHHV